MVRGKCDPRSGQSEATWSPGLQTEVNAKARGHWGKLKWQNVK